MDYILTSLIDDPNDYKIFSTENEFDIDTEERNMLGYFSNEKELAELLVSDNYWYKEEPNLAREDAEILMDDFNFGY